MSMEISKNIFFKIYQSSGGLFLLGINTFRQCNLDQHNLSRNNFQKYKPHDIDEVRNLIELLLKREDLCNY